MAFGVVNAHPSHLVHCHEHDNGKGEGGVLIQPPTFLVVNSICNEEMGGVGLKKPPLPPDNINNPELSGNTRVLPGLKD